MADVEARLAWTGEGLSFEGSAAGGPTVIVDGAGRAGPSPMQAIVLGVAACTAADVVEILGKMRVGLDALEVRIDADRAPEPPRRYTRIRLVYRTRGVPAGEEDKLRRAVSLSHEKYCSALHTLRPDVDVVTELALG
ncbi:MAG: OsmC family protein [Gemmatimonadota bacterium]